MTSGERDPLGALLERRLLMPVFQPIVALGAREFIGYEGLIRGPKDSPLRYPAALFQYARDTDRLFALERVARETTLQTFVDKSLHGSLFLNCSPEALTDPELHAQLIEGDWGGVKLAPERVVIEVTEVGSINLDERFDTVIEELKRAGYRIAIDDIGAGFGNAVLWDRMQPQIIKTDGRFASGEASSFKRAFIKSLFDLASDFDIDVIAEGVDSKQALRELRHIGIEYVQGFLVEMPAESPPLEPAAQLFSNLPEARKRHRPVSGQGQPPISSVITKIEPILASTLNQEVARRFEADEDLLALPVTTEEGEPLGIVHRYRFLNAFSKLYSRELYGKKPCTLMMQKVPLTVDSATPLPEVASNLPVHTDADLLAGVIVTRDGRYLGVVTLQQLIGAISELQVASARHANPLTNLPGNVPINGRIDEMLQNDIPFMACYIDIDRFKPFNDRYGFSAGDELILALARALEQCSADDDFVGHIGGDDFLALFVSQDWQERLDDLLTRFDGGLEQACSPSDLAAGGFDGEDRQGNAIFHALPTISIGAVRAEPEHFESHKDLSGWLVEAKKLAKQKQGHALFVERRCPSRAPGAKRHTTRVRAG